MAAYNGHKEIVEMLLPVSDPKASHSRALQEAAKNGYKEVVEMLLPVSDLKARGSEALRLAAKGGHKEIVEMLAPCYLGDEKTFHSILASCGMDSREFPFSRPRDSGMGPTGSLPMADKLLGRRTGRLAHEQAGERALLPRGA
jgi:hypothetical protein